MTTSITIELTDDQVAMLRSWGSALNAEQVPPDEARTMVGAIIRKAYAALPPEPVRVTVELPAGLAEKIRRHAIHVPDDAAVDLWRHVEQSLRQLNAQGVPLI